MRKVLAALQGIESCGGMSTGRSPPPSREGGPGRGPQGWSGSSRSLQQMLRRRQMRALRAGVFPGPAKVEAHMVDVRLLLAAHIAQARLAGAGAFPAPEARKGHGRGTPISVLQNGQVVG